MQFFCLLSLFAVTFSLIGAVASHKNDVDISLVANWNKTPFKLQVLESIAKLDDSLYQPLVLKLLGIQYDNDTKDYSVFDENDPEISDEDFYNYAISLLNDEIDISLANLYISNNLLSARIQTHYNYYNSTVKSTHQCSNDAVLFESVGFEHYCEKDAAFILKEVDHAMIFNSFNLPFDRWLGKNLTPKSYIIYGDYSDPYFKTMFFHMFQIAYTGKLNLVWRYVPDYSVVELDTLFGYGAALNLKRTDYIAIDDRGFSEEQQKRLDFNSTINSDNIIDTSDDEINEHNIFEIQTSDILKVAQSDISSLGLKTTNFILNSKHKIVSLINLISEFPKYAYAISKLNYSDETLSEIAENSQSSLQSYIPAGIYVNGAAFPSQTVNIFDIINTITRELSFIDYFAKINVQYSNAVEIMNNFANSMLSTFRNPSRRYDFTEYSKAIVYLNDIEIDKKYKDFLPAREAYKIRPSVGKLPFAKENIHEIILAVDITDKRQLPYLIQLYEQIISQSLPIRIGIIPFIESANSKWSEKAVSKLFGAYHESGPQGVVNYLYSLNRFVSSNEPLTLFTFRAFEEPFLDESLYPRYFDKVKELYTTFEINQNEPQVIANGVMFFFEEIDSALNQIFEDMMFLYGSLNNNKIPKSTTLAKFLRKNALKIRNRSLIPDTISQFKESYLSPTFNLIPFKHWASINAIRIVNEPKRNEALVTINLAGSMLGPNYYQQIIELLKYSQKAKGCKIVIVDIDATANFKEIIDLSVEEQINALSNMKIPSIDDDYEARDNAIYFKDLFNIPFKEDDIYMIINGRYVKIDEILSADIISSIVHFERSSRLNNIRTLNKKYAPKVELQDKFDQFEYFSWLVSYSYFFPVEDFSLANSLPRISTDDLPTTNTIDMIKENEKLNVKIVIDPVSEEAQELISFIPIFESIPCISYHIHLRPAPALEEIPVKRFYKGLMKTNPLNFETKIVFENVPVKTLFNVGLNEPQRWLVAIHEASTDLDNLKLDLTDSYFASGVFMLKHLLVEGYSKYMDGKVSRSPASLPVEIIGSQKSDTNIMANFGYFQLKGNPGKWNFQIKKYTKGGDIYHLKESIEFMMLDLDGTLLKPVFEKNFGMNDVSLIEPINLTEKDELPLLKKMYLSIKGFINSFLVEKNKQADINIFTVASGHLYERFLGIMISSVMKNTESTVKFWLIENYMSPDFKAKLPLLSQKYGFEYELIMYKWPTWLKSQRERQRTIWGYKILFLDVLFPQDLDKVIFVDSDQIVRTDLKELVDIDLEDAPYGYTPMCDSRNEMEGFRFWKTGYWKSLLGDEYKYHISALYVIDLIRFRNIAAGDILRRHYQHLSADPESLSNLDQDLPNNLQKILKIHSLPQEWLWCETWCSDETLEKAKTIDLCNNPLTKEPKLVKARRQIKEWTELDQEVEAIVSGKKIDKDLEHDEL